MTSSSTDISDLDIWDIKNADDWLMFDGNLQGSQGIRGYRQHASGGVVIAQTQAPFNAIFGLGGAAIANSISRISDYPQHVFSPLGGPITHESSNQNDSEEYISLNTLTEQTREGLLAENILREMYQRKKPLPIFQIRSEICNSSSASDIGESSAIALIEDAIDIAATTAQRLNQKFQVPVILLHFGFEHLSDDVIAYRDGIITVMKRLEAKLADHELPPPVFLASFDCGTQAATKSAAIKGQWELSWNCADHKLCFALPSYVLPHGHLGWLNEEGLKVESDYFTTALTEIFSNREWRCPVPYLAHRSNNNLRVVWQSTGPIIIDKEDPFSVGPMAGFTVSGIENDAELQEVKPDPNDDQALLLCFKKRPEGQDIQIRYAAEEAPVTKGNFPANRGAIREDWVGQNNGRSIFRWALPAHLSLSLEPME